MARLHEYQGKGLLAERGVAIPRGKTASTPAEAEAITASLGGAAVMKIQAWTTSRKAQGGVTFPDSPASARADAERLLKMKIGQFPVEQAIVEERLPIVDELFVSMSIDDAARAPVLLLSLTGGSGVEERAGQVHRLPVDPDDGVDAAEVQRLLGASPIDPKYHEGLLDAIDKAVRLAREVEARSLEINPLVTTEDGRVVAADCRLTIDDYAVFRHPELGIEIARELDHPPTPLERAAYRIEQADHRGTFYFAKLPTTGEAGERAIGFHGAGGGGSMMSMDAVVHAGFTPANFTDTSGNPSSAKVYAAARIILQQEGLVGYFGSGSGVASQEQHHSAYGLAKAFRELNLDIPAVIRLGGNSEDRAVAILESACADLPATVVGFRKDDPPARCAERFRELVDANSGNAWSPRERAVPAFVGSPGALSFDIGPGEHWKGHVWIDLERCDAATTAKVVERGGGVLRDAGGRPALAIDPEEAMKKDSEMIACEIECAMAGAPVVYVDLPIPGVDHVSWGER
ncbi:MAG: acetate--CoA ligase family protein [Phycisphaeraceae bacterium]|nr:acetate--CoA ligase family protein [Phycisphaeraceae bacterium]